MHKQLNAPVVATAEAGELDLNEIKSDASTKAYQLESLLSHLLEFDDIGSDSLNALLWIAADLAESLSKLVNSNAMIRAVPAEVKMSGA